MVMDSGLAFVQSLLTVAGALFAASGLTLWAMETGPESGNVNTRRRLIDAWRNLGVMPWRKVPRRLTGWLVNKLERLIRAGLQDADLGVSFGGIVFALMFGVLPALALLNAFIGGSPFLFWYYLSLLAAMVFLNFAGETRRLVVLNGLAAAYLGVSLIVVIPIYVLRSFTEMSIHNVFSQGILKSFLVVVFWYMAAYGVGLMFDTAIRAFGRSPGQWPPARFVHGFLAAVPVAFVLTFLALLAGQLAVFEQNPARSWQLVLFSTGFTALGLPVILTLMSLSAPAASLSGGEAGNRESGLVMVFGYGFGLCVAAGLSLALAYGLHYGTERALSWPQAANILVGLSADGARISLSPDFWVSHLPLLPWLAFSFAVFSGFVAKTGVLAVQAAAGPGAPFTRPFLTAAISCGLMAFLLWAAAWLM
jgi:hypothetical protein